MTDQEIDSVARILHILGQITDRRRRIDVAAAAMKIGIMANPGENDWIDEIRRVAGLT